MFVHIFWYAEEDSLLLYSQVCLISVFHSYGVQRVAPRCPGWSGEVKMGRKCRGLLCTKTARCGNVHQAARTRRNTFTCFRSRDPCSQERAWSLPGRVSPSLHDRSKSYGSHRARRAESQHPKSHPHLRWSQCVALRSPTASWIVALASHNVSFH